MRAQTPKTSWKLGDREVASPEAAADLVQLQGPQEAYQSALKDPKLVLTGHRPGVKADLSLGKAALASLAAGAVMTAVGFVGGGVAGVFMRLDFLNQAVKVGAEIGGALGLVAGFGGSISEQLADRKDMNQVGYLYQENGKRYFEAFPVDGDDIHYGCYRKELGAA